MKKYQQSRHVLCESPTVKYQSRNVFEFFRVYSCALPSILNVVKTARACLGLGSTLLDYVTFRCDTGDPHEAISVFGPMAREDQDVGALPALRPGHVRLRFVQLSSSESGKSKQKW